MIDGKQYISVAVGWGGGIPSLWSKATDRIYPGTVYTFAIGGSATISPDNDNVIPELIDLEVAVTKDEIVEGKLLYESHCRRCHGLMGMNGGAIPNLAYSNEAIFKIINDIVLRGAFLEKGMPNFSDRLTEDEVQLIKIYILNSAREMRDQK